MICPNCKAECPDGVKFCAKCGCVISAPAPVQRTNPPVYVVMQVTLKEKLIGTGSRNLDSLQAVINDQCRRGYRLHTITTASAQSTGFMGGDRIQATLVFESL